MNKELNRKPAEWAGVGVWHKEAGELEGHFEGSSIKFTESLDACFECLVPKLLFCELQYVGMGRAKGREFTATVSIKFANNLMWTAETPALALCLAIEKLIDGDK